MASIDPRLRQKMAGSPDETASVLITCTGSAQSVQAALAAKGLKTDGPMAGLEMLSATICNKDLKILETVEGIDAVEPDEDAQAL